MTTGDVADRVGHREHGQAERKSYPKKPDAEIWESGGQNRAPAAAKYEPERPKEFGDHAPRRVILHGSWLLPAFLPLYSTRQERVGLFALRGPVGLRLYSSCTRRCQTSSL